jgi:hypothetical protein
LRKRNSIASWLDAALPPATVTETLRSEHRGADAAFVRGDAADTLLVGVMQANGTSKVTRAKMQGPRDLSGVVP